MLKYEELLHFDEHYKKLQERNWIRVFWIFLSSTLSYTAIFVLLKILIIYLPDIYAWKHAKVWFTFEGIRIIKMDIIYFFTGLLMVIYASFRLKNITVQNHRAKNKSKNIPERLLKDGYYAKVRHPMYGTFVMLYMGVFLSLRSLFGVVATLLLLTGQYLNALFEEKLVLQVMFQEAYQQYKKEVKGILFKKYEIMMLIIVISLCILGFCF